MRERETYIRRERERMKERGERYVVVMGGGITNRTVI